MCERGLIGTTLGKTTTLFVTLIRLKERAKGYV